MRVFVPECSGQEITLLRPWRYKNITPHWNRLIARALRLPEDKPFEHEFPAGTRFNILNMYMNRDESGRVRLQTRINGRKPYLWLERDNFNEMDLVV